MAADCLLAVVPANLSALPSLGKRAKDRPEIANFVLPKDQNRRETRFAILALRTPRNLASENNTSKSPSILGNVDGRMEQPPPAIASAIASPSHRPSASATLAPELEFGSYAS